MDDSPSGRPLDLHGGDPFEAPPVTRVVVHGVVQGRPVVPHEQHPVVPAHASLELGSDLMREEVVEEGLALGDGHVVDLVVNRTCTLAGNLARNCSVINHFRFAAKSTGGREEDNALGRRRRQERRQERSGGAANCGGIGKWSGADSEQVSFVPRTVKVSGFTRNNSEDGGKGKMETNGARERKQRKLERQFREGEAIPVGSEIDRTRRVVGSLSLLLPSLEIN